MGQIVFQATLGGQTALVGQNTASSYSLTLPLATDTLIGKATTDTLTNKTISGSSNTLSNIGNSSLTNSSITIGSTSVSLGGTATTISGLTLTSGAFNGTLGATTPSTAVVTSLTDSGLTAGRVNYNGTGGLLVDSANLTFDGTNLGIGLTPTSAKGNLQVNTAISYTDTGILATFASSVAGYNQVILQNTNSGATASTNFNVSNNNGTATTNFGEFGINSSAFTGTGSFSQAGYTYLASASTDLAIGTYGSNAIHFVVNNGATDAMTIDTNGNLLVGNTSAIFGNTNRGVINVNGTSTALLSLSSGASTSTAGYMYWDGSNLQVVNNSTSGALTFNTNAATERMRITSTGNVGIGTSSPATSALLDVQSTSAGIRFPNMTTTQKNAISSPVAGLTVFDTTLGKLCVYSGSAWQTITSV